MVWAMWVNIGTPKTLTVRTVPIVDGLKVVATRTVTISEGKVNIRLPLCTMILLI